MPATRMGLVAPFGYPAIRSRLAPIVLPDYKTIQISSVDLRQYFELIHINRTLDLLTATCYP